MEETLKEVNKMTKAHRVLIGFVWLLGFICWYMLDPSIIVTVLICFTLHLLINISSVLTVGNIYKFRSLRLQVATNKKLEKILSNEKNGI